MTRIILRICVQLAVFQFRLVTFSQCFNQAYLEQRYRRLTSILPHGYRRRPTFTDVDWIFPETMSRIYMVGDAKGEYYGESSGSYMVQEFK